MNCKLIIIIALHSFSSFCFAQDKIHFKQIGTTDARVRDLCFTKFGSLLAVADSLEIDIYQCSNQKLVKKLVKGHTKRILSIDISADSSMLISGGCDSSIVIWNLQTSKPIYRKPNQKGIITSVKFSRDQKYYAVGSSDKTVSVYTLKPDSLVFHYTGHTNDITTVDFSPNGKLLACAGGDKKISIIEIENWKLVTTLKGHQDWIREVRFTNNNLMASCGDDSQFNIWDTKNEKTIGRIVQQKRGVRWLMSVDASFDSEIFIMVGFQSYVWIDKPPFRYRLNNMHSSYKVKIQPTNTDKIIFAVATMENGVLLYELNKADLNEKIIKQPY